MKRSEIFSIFSVAILLLHTASAGLLPTAKEASFFKDIIADTLNERNSKALETAEASAAPTTNEPSFFDQYYQTPVATQEQQQPPENVVQTGKKPCFPGDFLCHAMRNMKDTIGSEMSNAIIKSVATLMTDMLNTTVARSLDLMTQAQHENDQVKKEAEARQAINMVGDALQTVTSKVIQGFASFVKVSMSGAMWDLVSNVAEAASAFAPLGMNTRGSKSFLMTPTATSAAPAFVPIPEYQNQKPSLSEDDSVLITPSNLQNTNEIKRADVLTE